MDGRDHERESGAGVEGDARNLERFRDYLTLIARVQMDARHRPKYGASDVVQQTLIEANENRADFRGSTDEELAAWLRRILTNNIADRARALGRAKRDIMRERSIEAAADDSVARLHSWLAAVQSSPSQHAIRSEQVIRLADALARLSDAQRDAVTLHHLQGWTLAELAEHLGRSEAAVAGLIHRGLKKLRAMLDGDPE